VKLNGKVAIVTGGSRGIGAASARLLATLGAQVVVNYHRNGERAEQLVGLIREAGGEAQTMRADVHDPTDVEHLVSSTLDAYGHLDILVHNAPGLWVESSFVDLEWPDLIRAVESELKATFHLTKSVLPAMKSRGAGRLIYMASDLAKYPVPGALASGTAKAALVGLVRYIANELGQDGITANAVAPGFVETESNEGTPPEVKQQLITLTPLRRLARPEDVAGVVAFLASDDAAFITGEYLPVSGGFHTE
jgi:3-oxoacyl-[acyl-carrier protein] reductase